MILPFEERRATASCSIASRQNDQRHVTVSAARSNLGGTLRKAFHLAGQGLKKLRLHPGRL